MKSFLAPFVAIFGLILVCAGVPAGLLLWIVAALMVSPRRTQGALFAFPADNCSGRLIEVLKSTGCTLTAATVKPWTAADMEAAGMKEIGFDMEFSRLEEARAAGYVETELSMLVNSRTTNMKGALQTRATNSGKSMVFPFIPRAQRRHVNIVSWNVVSGTPNPNAGVGDVHPGAWDLIISNNAGTFGTNLPNIFHYFLPGRTLLVDYASSTNVAHHLQYEIIASVASGTSAKVTVKPNKSPAGWAELLAPSKLFWQIGGVNGGDAQPGTGAIIGANSVSDFESYKQMDTAINNLSLIYHPLQTDRIMWEYTDQFDKLLNNKLMGTFFKEFQNRPIATQRIQHQKLYEAARLNTIFFGQQENEFQVATSDAWMNLPTYKDPANENCILGYKTRAVGIQQQLINCGRYIDNAGGALNFDTLLPQLYLLKRAREVDASAVTTIDCITDMYTAGRIDMMFTDYFPKRYKQTNMFTMESGSILDADRKQVVFNYKMYTLPPEFGGIKLAVFSHPYFTDKLAFQNNNIHRTLWFLDWTDFYLGTVATNQRNTTTNILDELYRYVIDVNKKYVMNMSTTFAPILDDPNRHLIVRNFNEECPVLSLNACAVTSPS